MGNALSVVVGIICAVLMCIALVPLLGWLNWVVLVGCVFGVIAGVAGKKRSGVTINAVVAAVAMLRLALGGGVI